MQINLTTEQNDLPNDHALAPGQPRRVQCDWLTSGAINGGRGEGEEPPQNREPGVCGSVHGQLQARRVWEGGGATKQPGPQGSQRCEGLPFHEFRAWGL